MSRAFSTIKARILAKLGDTAGSVFDAAASGEVDNTINEMKDEVYDFVSNLRSDWGVKLDATITIAAGATSGNLPSDFGELISLQLVNSSTEVTPVDIINYNSIEKV